MLNRLIWRFLLLTAIITAFFWTFAYFLWGSAAFTYRPLPYIFSNSHPLLRLLDIIFVPAFAAAFMGLSINKELVLDNDGRWKFLFFILFGIICGLIIPFLSQYNGFLLTILTFIIYFLGALFDNKRFYLEKTLDEYANTYFIFSPAVCFGYGIYYNFFIGFIIAGMTIISIVIGVFCGWFIKRLVMWVAERIRTGAENIYKMYHWFFPKNLMKTESK